VKLSRYRFSYIRDTNLDLALVVGGHDLTSRLRPMIVLGLREEKHMIPVDTKIVIAS